MNLPFLPSFLIRGLVCPVLGNLATFSIYNYKWLPFVDFEGHLIALFLRSIHVPVLVGLLLRISHTNPDTKSTQGDLHHRELWLPVMVVQTLVICFLRPSFRFANLCVTKWHGRCENIFQSKFGCRNFSLFSLQPFPESWQLDFKFDYHVYCVKTKNRNNCFVLWSMRLSGLCVRMRESA